MVIDASDPAYLIVGDRCWNSLDYDEQARVYFLHSEINGRYIDAEDVLPVVEKLLERVLCI